MVGFEALRPWLPQSVLSLRHYDRRDFAHDLIAGITVGLVALPLAMAFAISSGMPPQAGIVTAVVAGFLISTLGGSTAQIGGPTGAFVVVVSGIVATYGVDGLFMCTLMAGVFLVLLGVTGLGVAVRYFPRPVVIGFTNGIAVLIASTQIRDFFGLTVARPSGVFLPRLIQCWQALPTISLPTTLVGVGTLAVVVLVPRLWPRLPGAIVAMLLATVVVAALRLPIETIGTRFGGIPAGVPPLHFPRFHPDLIHTLLPSALTVGMLGAIESLLSATVADRMSGHRHRPNVELIAQGVANMATPLVGGLPATGAIARTATNIRSGGRTPVSGVIHAMTLLAVLVFAAPLAKNVPLSALSAILFVVAWGMGEWREIPEILKLSRSDQSVWLVTFALTVFADLTIAVEAGMILAALLFIRKVSATTSVSTITNEGIASGREHELQDRVIPEYVSAFRIHGPFLFGTTDKLEDITGEVGQLGPVVLLRLREMSAIDATGMQALEDLSDRLRHSGRTLVLCGARGQPALLMRKAEFDQHVGHRNIRPNIGSALERARELVASDAFLNDP
jgi:SulP family sulfate permease